MRQAAHPARATGCRGPQPGLDSGRRASRAQPRSGAHAAGSIGAKGTPVLGTDGDRTFRRPQDSVGALRPPGKGTDTVTQQKALKQRVRARMAKTGERYTSARANVLRKSAGPGPASPAEAAGTAAEAVDAALRSTQPVPDSPFRSGYGASDEALVKRTGHDWAHWYRILDSWGAADRPHPEIARFLNLDLGVDGWWSQELTVRYEMAIGRRMPNQRKDGFEATAAKTVKAPPERVYEAVVDAAQRSAWLDRPVKLRKANQNRTASAFATVRFDWEDGSSRIVVWMADKGDRTAVSLAHQKLVDSAAAEELKAFWRARLAALAAYLERPG